MFYSTNISWEKEINDMSICLGLFYEERLRNCVNCMLIFTFFVHGYVISNHHHHLVVPSAWISLTLSRHPSLSFISSGRSTHCILTELLYVDSSWSSCFCSGHVKGSIEVLHLWALPYFSSSVLHVWFV